jgi:hypothetical protein
MSDKDITDTLVELLWDKLRWNDTEISAVYDTVHPTVLKVRIHSPKCRMTVWSTKYRGLNDTELAQFSVELVEEFKRAEKFCETDE